MWDEDSEASSDNQDSLCMILAEEKIRHHERELQTGSTWTCRKYEVVKNLKGLQFRGSHSGNYHAIQIREQIWCQKMT